MDNKNSSGDSANTQDEVNEKHFSFKRGCNTQFIAKAK